MNSFRNLLNHKIQFWILNIYKKRSLKKLIVLVLIFTLTFPISANALVGPVPVSDDISNTKEVGVTVFGVVLPGASLDSIAYFAAKLTLETVLNTTTRWVNSGFQGNPLYATNPEQFFIHLADNIAGEYIKEIAPALCSPFSLQVKIALQASQRDKIFQCSLTGVVANIEGFYDDFSEGGWDGWFAMTQSISNNPYGAYITGRIEMNQRIAQAINIQQQQLSWNKGFISWRECLKTEEVAGPTQDGKPLPAECTQYGPVKTPGSVIEDQLALQLGTGVRQLELADEFNELVGALFVQLISRVLSEDGLF